MRQDDLFEVRHMTHEEMHILSWQVCWGWHGPVAGEYCEVNTPIVSTAEGGKLYCYMERCRLVEELEGGSWLAEIDMPPQRGESWGKNGARLVLAITDIWPNCRHFEHDA